jgi:cytochrome b
MVRQASSMRIRMQRIRVWDLPTRLFHWALVVLLFLAWATQEYNHMEWHEWIGYTILALLIFRVVWGLIGSDTSRFSWFLRSPLAALRHLKHLHRREDDTEVGHNAAGGWMVLVMLALILVQAGTGLFANDDANTEGPLMHFVSKDQSDYLSHIHSINFNLIEIAIALHVLAIVAYLVLKRHNLVGPMITGTKRLPEWVGAPRMRSPLLALAVLIVAAGVVAWVVQL